MSFTRLLLRNLLYHWRGNLAVLLGAAVSTAVLTGALLVGDSLRGSLADLTRRRLGWVDQALVANRFFQSDLASPEKLACRRAAGLILLQGTASKSSDSGEGFPASETVHRAGKVTLFGVDDSFFGKGDPPFEKEVSSDAAGSAAYPVYLNGTLAADLGVHTGDAIVLHLQKVSLLPRESLLGRRDTGDVVDKIRARIVGILNELDMGNRFSLSPSPEPPRNAFLPLNALQELVNQPGRINVLLVEGGSNDLKNRFLSLLRLDDWGLQVLDPAKRTDALFGKLDRDHRGRLRRGEWQGRVAETFARVADADHNGELTRQEVLAYYEKQHPYLTLESRQVLLEPPIADAALLAAKEAGLQSAPTLVYLANSIAVGDKSIPYSTIAALDPSLPPPLGPFLRDSDKPLEDDEILLAAWDKSPLQAKPGDRVSVSYFPAKETGQVKEERAIFRLRGFVPLEGVGNDPDLTPEFPGITDSKTITLRDWNLPSPPFDNSQIRKVVGANDEDYWKKYRTTPKAYVNLETGKRLWGSRFGQLTSIRLASAKGQDQTVASQAFEKELLRTLNPDQGGFVFENLREEGLSASAGSMDFGWLLLFFSFFLILASLLLVGLLFRLNLDRRAAEVGLLLASGYRRRHLRLLLLGEGSILALVGALAGLAIGYAYALFLLDLLQSLWPTTTSLSFLRLHAERLSVAIGFGAALIMSFVAISWAIRILGKVSPTALLMGETAVQENPGTEKRARWSVWISIASLALAVVLTVGGLFVKDHEARAGSFFGSGAFLLTAGLAALWAGMKRTREGFADESKRTHVNPFPPAYHVGAEQQGSPERGERPAPMATPNTSNRAVGPVAFNIPTLAWRNTARNPLRSMLTAGLLAAAAFLIVAVELFRQHADSDPKDVHSGTGGFALLGETDVPVFQNLNEDSARAGLLDVLERQKQEATPQNPDQAQARLEKQKEILDQLRFVSFRVKAGEDASCLNLYQPKKPRLLGVPPNLIERNAFTFADTEARSPETTANPWRLLEQDLPNGEIPVIGEAETVTWILENHLGGAIAATDDRGEKVALRIVALLQGSIFQSGLLLSEANLLKLYPSQEGYTFFLIDTGKAPTQAAKEVVETVLADHGMEATPTAERLESYLAVRNTYLSTFQALGALGLLLGAVGLAVVLLRGIWERRAELALLRALGYRKPALGRLLFLENGFLLLFGLGIGTLAAVLAVLPSLFGGEAAVPWLRLLAMLGGVLAFGLLCAFGTLTLSLRTPVLEGLRRE
ncbi:MAG: FtsX-like permease family protein [Gemmataceae bacterium]